MEEMRKIGDVRVSKQEQQESLHIDALEEAGCEKWSTVIPYFTSANSMPNMFASSAVILTRY
jgi:DNA invertase Pin-like site-specific DNA recombinase